ncbi:MAG: efflux RND transporter periplasmic adaptor subunit [Desulfonatronovibrionaceae bacterium]
MRFFLPTLLVCLILFPAPGFAQSKDKNPPPLVQAETVTLENANRPKKYIGHVEAIESIDLRARVQGYLEEVNFKEGASVKKGDLLYVIEQPPYEARLESAEAKVTQAEANLFKAETRLTRLRSAPEESVRQTDIDDAIAARDLAEGNLKEVKANLKIAKLDLDYTTIEAPVDGRLGKSFFQAGALVGPEAGPLGRIVRTDPVRVRFSVGEKRLDSIQSSLVHGKPLSVNIEMPGNKQYPGKGSVEFMDNKVDSKTGTISVWARFDNPEGRLVPGEYVKVFLQSAEKDMQPAVPQRAVQADKEGDFVFTLNKEDEVEKRRIQTGESVGNKFLVKSGLSKGDRVIVQGIQKAAPGMSVKVDPVEKKDN